MKTYNKSIKFIALISFACLWIGCSKQETSTNIRNTTTTPASSNSSHQTDPAFITGSVACLQGDSDFICGIPREVTEVVTTKLFGSAFEDCHIIARYTMIPCHKDLSVPTGADYYHFYNFGFAIPELDPKCDGLRAYLDGLSPEEREAAIDQLYLDVRESGIDSFMQAPIRGSRYYCNGHGVRDYPTSASLHSALCYYRCEDLVPDSILFPDPGFPIKGKEKSTTRNGDPQALYRYYKHVACGDGCCIVSTKYCVIGCGTSTNPDKLCGYRKFDCTSEQWGDCLNQVPRPNGCGKPPEKQGCLLDCIPFKEENCQ